MAERDKSSRRLPNWIESFIRNSEAIQSPKIFRLWAAIGLVSSVMERKVWAFTKGSNLYPNLYVVLVATPGKGKSEVLKRSERMARMVTDAITGSVLHIAPSSVTTASLIDSLHLATRVVYNPVQANFHSLQVIGSELGVFLPSYDPAFMNTLTKLYDGEFYEERRRTGKVNHITLECPLLSIIGGTTPSYLNSTLPDGAWDQGFTSRSIFIFSGEFKPGTIFGTSDDALHTEQLFQDLLFDLRQINKLAGKVTWADDAMASIEKWNMEMCPPIPAQRKLTHYNSRRMAHVLKLCIVASAAKSDSLRVTLEDFRTARDWLLEAEQNMGDLFIAGGVTAEGRHMDDLYFHLITVFNKNGRTPISASVLVSFLRDRVDSWTISKVIQTMCDAGDLKLVIHEGSVHYIPLSRPDQ
jgi:hypothetical protein